MDYLQEKYVNPFTDFGFKKLFGEEPNKDLLLDFLNELLKDEQGQIVSITYLRSEQLGDTSLDRKAIFDLYCENERGEKFIVELQKTKQKYFKDRTLYYATFPIREQAKLAEWDFELKAVYTIAILDFVFDEDKNDLSKFRYDVKLQDIDTNKIFYDKLTFIYLEMPKFTKTIDELETRFDKWLYIIRNLTKMDQIPEILQEKIFKKLFKAAEIAKFTPSQVSSYEQSIKVFRDNNNTFNTAIEEGFNKGMAKGIEQGIEKGIEQGIQKGIEQGIEKGIEKGKEKGLLLGKAEGVLEVAKNMIQLNISVEQISKATGLSVDEINKLR
jgi:predicted transposase/invertase (TIGR01784 family)